MKGEKAKCDVKKRTSEKKRKVVNPRAKQARAEPPKKKPNQPSPSIFVTTLGNQNFKEERPLEEM